MKPALPKNKGSKQGGQNGYKGLTLQQVKVPDNIVCCTPGVCTCGHEFESGQLILAEKRQVLDFPEPKLEVAEYQIFKASCPSCGQEQKGVAPECVNAPVQKDNKIKAFSVLLIVHYKLLFKKIQLLFSDLFGYPVNESTTSTTSERCYNKLEGSEKIIKSRIFEDDVVHADETGLRVEGKLHWLHTAITLLYTYLFVREKRGKEAIQSDKSILRDYWGWLVHDCWGSYFNLQNSKHAICGAPLLTELQGLTESYETKWAKVFKSFLLSVYMMPFEERVRRRQHIESRYDRICGYGEKAELPLIKTAGRRGRLKRTEGRNLVERLIREKDAVLAFAFNKEVPFNLAERDLRPTKVKQKVSNSFRTFKGAENISKHMNILVTGTRGIPDILGGVEIHCEALYPRLVAKGVSVTLVRRRAYVEQYNKVDGYKGIKLVDIYSPKKKSFEAIVHTFLSVLYAWRMGSKILHIHSIGPSLVIPFARLLGLKVVMTNHGPDYNRQKWGKIGKASLKLGEWCAAKFASEIIVISDTINTIQKEKYGRQDSHLIHNGVVMPAQAKKSDYIKSLGLEPQKYMIAVGRFVPEKGLHDLLEATQNINKAYKVVFVGDTHHPSTYSEKIKQKAKEKGVVLTGFIKGEQLHQVFSFAALFIMPSYHEGLPIALLEALSYNLKTVVSNIPANMEVGLEAANYFEVGDTTQLAEKINSQLASTKENQYETLLKGEYNWDTIALQTLEVYKKLMVK